MRTRDIPRTAGWALATAAAAAWLALVEVFWLPLRVAGVLVPLSLVAAVVGNVALVGLAHRRSGSRVVAVLPAAVWLVIAGAATMRRPEGDLLLTGGGAAGLVNLAFLLGGLLAAAIAVGRAIGTPLPGRVGPGRDAAPVGSASGGRR